MVGETVGNYRIVRKIGEGGMGAVYLAEHTLLGRRAAIKMLLRELSHRDELVTRFFNEARAASAVKHPGIVEIYDFGHHSDGSAYIVMEFLEGESLSTRLRTQGVMAEARAASLCRQVGGALAAAHAKGIVHRDLKPDNIFIVRDTDIAGGERAKVLDFGIAKLASDQPGQQSMTRTGMVMGTPAYMAPEQCKGAGNVDQRSDLYALGCILFEMMCGRPPFVAEGAGEVMAHHIFTPPPPPSSIAPVTPMLEQIILRALCKDPDHRFRAAEEMIAALQAVVPSGSFVRAGAGDPTMMPGARPSGPLASAPGSTPPYVPGSAPPHVPGSVPPYVPTPAPGYYPASAAPTTMSGAAGATTRPAQIAPRRGWLLPAAAIVVLAAGGGVLAVTQSGSHEVAVAKPPEPTKPPAPAKPPDVAGGKTAGSAAATGAAGSAAPAAKPPLPPPPIKVAFQISSNPPGAEVFLMPESVRVGTTPFVYTIDAIDVIDAELVLRVKKRGYRDEPLTLRTEHPGEYAVTLVRKPTTAPATPRPSADDFFTRTPAPAGSADPAARPKK